jgi:hypothetical protein
VQTLVSGFSGSPKLVKGGVVAYQPPDLVPTIIVFQYNPDEVRRTLASRSGSGGGAGERLRAGGPPDETIAMSVEIDAADQLERPGENAVAVANGLHPAIAALEGLMHPSFPIVVANQAAALAGTAFIAAEQTPLALLVWGARRVLPVQVTGLSITEQAFDPQLNPIRAAAELQLRVLTYRDLEPTSPAYWVYMASFTQKEVMAALNIGQETGAITDLLPF